MYPSRKDAPQAPRSRFFIWLFFILSIGSILVFHPGGRFVFYYERTYVNIALCSSLLIAPFALYRLKRWQAFDQGLARRYPTHLVRRWILLPLTAFMLVGMLFAAPLGWLFAAAALIGGAESHVHAVATEVSPHSRRKGCDQRATLRFASADKDLCLDGLYPPAAMQPGEALTVGIRTFPFGFQVVSIQAATLN